MVARSKLLPIRHDSSGLVFYFAWDRNQPDKLHVDVRGTSPETAIETFIASTVDVWNEERKRWERQGERHGVYWRLLNDQPGHILIISCFALEG